MLKFVKRIAYFIPRWSYKRPLFCFKDKKNTGLLIFNSLKQKKLIFNFFVNRNWKKLTDSVKATTPLRPSYVDPVSTCLHICLCLRLCLCVRQNQA